MLTDSKIRKTLPKTAISSLADNGGFIMFPSGRAVRVSLPSPPLPCCGNSSTNVPNYRLELNLNYACAFGVAPQPQKDRPANFPCLASRFTIVVRG